MPLVGKIARQHNMPIQNGTHGIRYWLIEIIAIDKHGVNSRNRALCGASRPFQKLGQVRENRRRIALGGWRLANGQANFPGSHGETRNRIHHQKHVHALVAKIFSCSCRRVCRAHTHKWRLIRSCDNQDRAGHAFRAKIALHEFHNFPATFTNQGNDVDIGLGIACHHAHQGGFAHPGPGHDAHALALAKCDQAVDATHAHIKNICNARPHQGAGRIGVKRRQARLPGFHGLVGPLRHKLRLEFVLPLKIRGRILVLRQGRCVDFRADWRPGIKRRAKGVKRASQKMRTHGKNGRQAGIANQASRSDAAHIAVGHEKQVIVRKTHNFCRNSLAFVFWQHVANSAKRGAQAPPLGHKADNLVDLAVNTHW